MNETLSPLKQWAQMSPSLCALKTAHDAYTWEELSGLVMKVSSHLNQQELKPGDVLTCVGKNSVELLIVYLACIELGVICAMTMPQTYSELRKKLDTLYSSSQPPKIWVSTELEELRSISTIQYGESLLATNVSAYQSDNLASIVFTSGSTGSPKAVAHTSKQHLSSASGLLEQFSFKQGDTWLLSLPMYHVSGLAIVYRWLQSGATMKVGAGSLDEDILGVSHASLVATQLKRLLEQGVDLSLSHVLLGGSHVPLELSQKAATKGIETWLGYGMTEAASTVTAKRIDEHYSAGKVLPNRELKLEGQRIYIGGETLASGYYYQGELIPLKVDGWFDSKDLGEWVSGELKIIGRADNLFISGGENVHCEEIESALLQLDAISLAVVIPIQDSEFGQRPVAVCDFSRPLSKAEIEAHLATCLTKFKWPIAYYSMPKQLLESGIKVSRQAVKEWLLEQI
ncbi:o-succinylbenzoate--CoA ligase [Vibrio sp. TBV020]|uniref:o-succinylbenzoate--CoA ligase n=1 Tax=Vibrio sp. TBV020 TaxID=3137398 RepID=UPI0038CD7C29